MMVRGLRKISTKGMSREEWLERRRKTIGGSDAAGIVGLSKWASPFSVWADKTGRAAEAAFWKQVEQDIPPVADGSEATTAALQEIYPVSLHTTTALFGRDAVLQEYMRLKEDKKALDFRIGEIENTIKADLGNAESGSCGLFNVSWKSQTRQTFQTKEFAKDHPNIDLTPYYKNTNLRPFKVTERTQEAV